LKIIIEQAICIIIQEVFERRERPSFYCLIHFYKRVLKSAKVP